jgi:hypothetical protein
MEAPSANDLMAISVWKWAHFHRRRVPPHRRLGKQLRGASWHLLKAGASESDIVHYPRDPRKKAG